MLRYLTWPHLIGIATGSVGAALVLFCASDFVIVPFTATADRAPTIVLLAAAVLLILLSISLYRGRDWARRVLVLIVAVAALGSTVRACSYFFMTWSGQPDERMAGSALLGDLGRLILFFIVPTALVAALCHADVVSSFKRQKDTSEA